MLDTQDTYMGLNEPQIGLAVPPLVRNLLARIVGEARADGLTFLGKYSNPKDAYRFGLVDELVASPTESAGTAEAIATLRAVAVKRAAAAASIPAPGRVDTKLASRSAFAALLKDHERLKRESEGWAKSAQDPAKAAAFEASFAKFAGGAKKTAKL
ncbi:hypothetical protein HK405_002738 [Cladochytrium tenue]|nr:hypothetical protein HK405_002738 [Cladochytrium tenue]